MKAKQQARYVRLSPITLFKVPDCYGSDGKPELSSTSACSCCFLKKRCEKRQEVVWR